VTDAGATFRSHIDGSLLELTPERAVQIQETLGSDVAMVLDHVVPLPADDAQVRDACTRTIAWAKRAKEAAKSTVQAQFGIVQGGLNAELRVQCAEALRALEFPGYAIGGLSVGESGDERNRVLDATCPALPADRPRYLMGVGRPEDLLDAIRRGVDLFDCVMPTRNGRNALAFTDEGPLRLRNLTHQLDDRPLDEKTHSPASRHSRGYIRHLFMADEMLGPILLSLHNIAYYQRLMAEARAAIAANQFAAFHAEKLRGWRRLGEGDASL
jgi:queuine tRNA-ribosyltransferase